MLEVRTAPGSRPAAASRATGALAGDPAGAVEGARGFVGIIGAKGPLRADLDEAAAGDAVWALIDASLYHRLAIERGWPKERFRAWLQAAFEAQLLPG